MKIAIIPARGGSKRVPKKNIKPFGGQPMIAHPIKMAIQSGIFQRVFVSTENIEISGIARMLGAEIIVRPNELADDFTGTIPVIQHAIRALERDIEGSDHVCCIYPATPFLSADDLREGYKWLDVNKCDFTFAAAKFPHSIFRGMVSDKTGVKMVFPEHFSTRTQDLPEAFYDVGQYYWGTAASWLFVDRLFSDRSTAVLLPRWKAVDIDTDEDWIFAELLWSAFMNQHHGHQGTPAND